MGVQCDNCVTRAHLQQPPGLALALPVALRGLAPREDAAIAPRGSGLVGQLGRQRGVAGDDEVLLRQPGGVVHPLLPGYTVDVKGYIVDAKGYMVDVKGYIMDAKGYMVDVKGYIEDAKGYTLMRTCPWYTYTLRPAAASTCCSTCASQLLITDSGHTTSVRRGGAALATTTPSSAFDRSSTSPFGTTFDWSTTSALGPGTCTNAWLPAHPPPMTAACAALSWSRSRWMSSSFFPLFFLIPRSAIFATSAGTFSFLYAACSTSSSLLSPPAAVGSEVGTNASAPDAPEAAAVSSGGAAPPRPPPPPEGGPGGRASHTAITWSDFPRPISSARMPPLRLEGRAGCEELVMVLKYTSLPASLRVSQKGGNLPASGLRSRCNIQLTPSCWYGNMRVFKRGTSGSGRPLS
eukprot:1195068-Prorocentrum_minimum.AAC.1